MFFPQLIISHPMLAALAGTGMSKFALAAALIGCLSTELAIVFQLIARPMMQLEPAPLASQDIT